MGIDASQSPLSTHPLPWRARRAILTGWARRTLEGRERRVGQSEHRAQMTGPNAQERGNSELELRTKNIRQGPKAKGRQLASKHSSPPLQSDPRHPPPALTASPGSPSSPRSPLAPSWPCWKRRERAWLALGTDPGTSQVALRQGRRRQGPYSPGGPFHLGALDLRGNQLDPSRDRHRGKSGVVGEESNF